MYTHIHIYVCAYLYMQSFLFEYWLIYFVLENIVTSLKPTN